MYRKTPQAGVLLIIKLDFFAGVSLYRSNNHSNLNSRVGSGYGVTGGQCKQAF